VNVDLYVLRAVMLDWIRYHVDVTHIVTIDNGGCLDWNMEIIEKLAQPTTFGNNMGHRLIFRLGTRSRHGGLSF
jgi:hypothetical protein